MNLRCKILGHKWELQKEESMFFDIRFLIDECLRCGKKEKHYPHYERKYPKGMKFEDMIIKIPHTRLLEENSKTTKNLGDDKK